MPKHSPKFVYSICFIFLSFSSCQLSTLKNLEILSLNIPNIQNIYFSDPSVDYLYKANIEAYGNLFGGILVIKKLGKEHHRIAFTTEFGAKIFDFDFNGDEFKVKYIIDKIDRKVIINTLRKDFQILIKEELGVNKQYKNKTQKVFQCNAKKGYNFYYLSTNDVLKKIIHTSKRKEKIVIDFNSTDGKRSKEINIQHHNISLSIQLKEY